MLGTPTCRAKTVLRGSMTNDAVSSPPHAGVVRAPPSLASLSLYLTHPDLDMGNENHAHTVLGKPRADATMHVQPICMLPGYTRAFSMQSSAL